ncbi:MAG: polyprenyl diphosphate synthase, partial [Pseudomonadales bacterium]
MTEISEELNTSPKHVAIIMDGNNRWAKDRNLTGYAGHQAGADRLKDVIEGCLEQGVEVLTVFAFSSENWSRSKQEVGALMSLFSSVLKRYKKDLRAQDISLTVIGRRDRFSYRLQKLISDTERATAGGKYRLVVAAD